MSIQNIRKMIPLLAVFTCAVVASADVKKAPQPAPLGQNAVISLLTVAPSDEAAYTLYGHTAIRVYDPKANRDLVFNYGIFDFSKPNFIYRFAKGETDYKLQACNFDLFIAEYSSRGSQVCEQILNLLDFEREEIWQALALNARPENCVYRYSFFFDNCATRPAAMIVRHINAPVQYACYEEVETFRNLINNCTRRHEWLTFGCDLVVGEPADKVMILKQTFFLPQYLQKAFATAQIVRPDGLQPLVVKTSVLSEHQPEPESKNPPPTPLECALALLAIVLIISWLERFFSPVRLAICSIGKWFDFSLFAVSGLAGCVLFFLGFISVHPSLYPNVWLFWLHPFHILSAILLFVKRFDRFARIFFRINCVAILTANIAWIFIIQHFNIAFAPLMAILLLRYALRAYTRP